MVVWEQWNDVVAHQSLEGRKDVVRQSGTMSWNQTPAVANKAKLQAKKKIGQYDGNSVLAVIVALDDFLKKAQIVDAFLSRYSNQFSDVQEFHQGIAHPRKA